MTRPACLHPRRRVGREERDRRGIEEAVFGAAEERLPRFREIKPGTPTDINPGSRLYGWEAAIDLWFFIVLVPSIKEADGFWIEVAWSRDGRLPGHFPTAGGGEGERANLGKLMGARNSLYRWEVTTVGSIGLLDQEAFDEWLQDPEKLEAERIRDGLSKVPRCVEEAIDRIVLHALPYFEVIARDRGYAPPAATS